MSESEIIDYAAWGELFFASAVTAERVLAGVNVLAGRPIDVGPLGVGPGRIAKVRARGEIGTATGHRSDDRPVTFAVTLPVSLEFMLELGMDKHKFDAQLSVPLAIAAQARSDLTIHLHVTPPSADEVGVDLQARGIRASIMQYAGRVEPELKRFVANYVAREIDKPYVQAARTIDIAGRIDQAAASLGSRRTSGDGLTEDLPEALESEIIETADRYLEAQDVEPGEAESERAAPEHADTEERADS